MKKKNNYVQNPRSWKGVTNDVNLASTTPKDPLKVPLGPIIRLGAKRFKEAINRLLQDT